MMSRAVAMVTLTTASGMTCPGSPAGTHCGMELTTTAAASCATVSAEINARLAGENGWYDQHNRGTYTKQNYGGDVSASRRTGDGKYTDKMVFTLTDQGGSCLIEACSESQVFSIGDAGTNYCNVKLLVCGSDQGCKVAKNDFKLGDENTSKKAQASVNMGNCLAASTLTATDTNLAPYPGYAGELSVTGTVGGYLYGNDAYIWYNIAGLEAECATAPEGVANACGIHIHEGKTCDDADSVGGHYYDGESMSADPWASITYQASADGTSKGKTSASIGAGQDINGRAIVVHDKTGARVACALIEGKLSNGKPTWV